MGGVAKSTDKKSKAAAEETGLTSMKVKLKAATPKPANYVKELELRKRQMEDQLHQVEVQIYKLETQYIEGVNPRGNALKGYDGLLSSSAASQGYDAQKKKGRVDPENRIFSKSSASFKSEAVEF